MAAPVAETNHDDRPRRRPVIQSLDRGLVILEAVAKSTHPVSLNELAEIFGIDRSSAFRLADTLKRRGFLACTQNSRGYVLGPSTWRLAQMYDWNGTLVKVARPFLQFLATQTGETAHLAIREGAQALFIDNVVGSHLITVSGQVGEFVPLHATAHGKALLADYSAAELRALLGGGPLQSHTPQTITSVERLAEVCAQLRTQGFILDDSEYQETLRCAAAPVRDRDGAVIGSIGISAPAARMPEQLRLVRAGQVLKVARDIRTALSTPARQVPVVPDRRIRAK
jgi:IclR family transcriptional regulator, acetate operon repressor